MGEQQKGYVPAYADNSSFYIPGVLHVERDDSRMLCEDDEAASVLAEEDGIRLVYGMEGVPDGVYIDTPENRDAIIAGLEKYPEYREGPRQGRISEGHGQFPDMGMCFGKG